MRRGPIVLAALALLAGGGLFAWLVQGSDDRAKWVHVADVVDAEKGAALLPGNARRDPVDVVREPTVPQTVIRVVATQGESIKPLPNATVTLLSQQPRAGVLIDSAAIVEPPKVTDAQGECSRSAAGDAWVLSQKVGYAPRVTRLTGLVADHLVELEPLLAEVAGSVVDTAGKPVPGARIAVCPGTHSTTVHVRRGRHGVAVPVVGLVEVTTDIDGRFRAPVADDGGNVRVDVLAEGYVTGGLAPMPEGAPAIAWTVAAPGDLHLRLIVQPVRMILVRVLNKRTGKPLQARASITPVVRSGPLKGLHLSHEQVLFSGDWRTGNIGIGTEWSNSDWDPSKLVGFVRIPAGATSLESVKIMARVPGFTAQATDVPLFASGDVAHWTNLRLEWAASDLPRTVRIAVTRKYPPAVWSPRQLQLRIPGFGTHHLVSVGAEGATAAEYSFDNVPDRDVTATLTDGISATEVILRYGVNAGYEASLIPSAITLALRDSNGVPLYGAYAWCLPEGTSDDRYRHFLLPAATTPHESGRQVAQAFNPGQYVLHVVKPGYEPVEKPIEVLAGQISAIKLTLVPSGP